MDTTSGSMLLIGVIVGAVLGAGTAWFLVTARSRLTAAEAARAAADASAMLRADAAGLRAERAGLLKRLDELAETHERTVERLRQADADAAATAAALRSERAASAQREELITRRDVEL